MNGYKTHHSGLRTRMMWLNGRRFVVSAIGNRRWTFATVETSGGMHFSDDFGNGYAS